MIGDQPLLRRHSYLWAEMITHDAFAAHPPDLRDKRAPSTLRDKHAPSTLRDKRAGTRLTQPLRFDTPDAGDILL